LSQLVAPYLLERCIEALKTYTEDERRSGLRPLPFRRREEVVHLLKCLLECTTNPKIEFFLHEPEDEKKDTELKPLLPESRKKLLLKLFPVLCDCVIIKEPSFKELLREIFHRVSKEMRLE
jgi:hypothetical protein